MTYQQSESINEIAAALAAFRASVPAIEKDGHVDTGKFSFEYATLDHILECIVPSLSEHGLSVSQLPDAGGITTTVMHTSGQWIRAFTPYHTEPRDVKQYGGLITYMRRYALSAVLSLSTQTDNDFLDAESPKKRGPSKTKDLSDANMATYIMSQTPYSGKDVLAAAKREFGVDNLNELDRTQADDLLSLMDHDEYTV